MKLNLQKLQSHFIPPQSGILGPVLLLVHGRTGNLRLLEWCSKRFQIPSLSYLSVQAPFEDKREGQNEPGYSWYLDQRQGLETSREILAESISELDEQGVPPENLFWLGFSQGAVMGLDTALRAPFRLGGFMCISGFCLNIDEYPQAFGLYAKKQRILATHGTRDEVISFEKAKDSYERLIALGVPLQFREYDKPHSFHLKSEVPYLELALKEWISNA